MADDVEPVLVPYLHGLKVKSLREFRQPPVKRLLDQMGIPAVRKRLDRRPSVDRDKRDGLRQLHEMVKNILEKIRLDVLQHINTRNHLSWHRLSGEVRNARVVRLISELVLGPDALAEVHPLARTIV